MLRLGMDRSCSRGSGIGLSQRRMNPQYSLEEIQEYLAKQEEVASFMPEETHTIKLTKTPEQRLGLTVVGGSDNPNLKEVHVSK